MLLSVVKSTKVLLLSLLMNEFLLRMKSARESGNRRNDDPIAIVTAYLGIVFMSTLPHEYYLLSFARYTPSDHGPAINY